MGYQLFETDQQQGYRRLYVYMEFIFINHRCLSHQFCRMHMPKFIAHQHPKFKEPCAVAPFLPDVSESGGFRLDMWACAHTLTRIWTIRTWANIQTYGHTYKQTDRPTYLHNYMPTVHACIPTCLHSYIPSYLYTYVYSLQVTFSILRFTPMDHTADLRRSLHALSAHDCCLGHAEASNPPCPKLI